MRRIGIVGATGAVGQSVVAHLRQAGAGPLRLGGRRQDRLARLAVAGEEVVALDLRDADALGDFCAGCAVVVNAAGPTSQVLDRIALAALAAEADYVDAAGDETVHDRLSPLPLPTNRRLILSAGIMPGLTALLPRWLAAHRSDWAIDGAQGGHLTGFIGGLDRFTETAAGDYVASLSNGYGIASAAWRQGRAARALTPLHDTELPFFPRLVSAFPYLSQENERVAVQLGLDRGDWYNVFEGRQIMAAFGDIQRRLAEGGEAAAITALCRAADLDLAGHQPYQVLVCRLAQGDATTTVLLRTSDAYTLTGAFAALTAVAVQDAALPVGLHFAGEVMAPAATIERLRRSPAVTALESMADRVDAAVSSVFEEGTV